MLELKTTPPALRPGLVMREDLLCRLESSSAPVVALVAPAGYGKTTVLSQYVTRTGRPVAWLNLDEGDADPGALIAALAKSLAKPGLLAADGAELAVESGSVLIRGVENLLEEVDSDAKGVLILDHLDALPSQSSLDVIGALMARARERLQLMVAARAPHGLPFGLLRTHGDLLELGIEELAFNMSETEEVFRSVGIEADLPLDAIMEHTEGWPAAVYLTAQAMNAGSPPPDASEVRGNDVYLVEYLREELMDGLSDDVQGFLLRSSILPRMSGDLCDYVLEMEHAGQILDRLEEANLLVVPMDRTRGWYRYHSLLRDYLQSELHNRLGEEQSRLHLRASAWFENHGFDELAIDHARRSEDDERVARLIAGSARTFYAKGRFETLTGWFDWLEGSPVARDFPDLAAVGAFARALGGNPRGAQRMAHLAYDDSSGLPRDDVDLGPLSLMVRAFLAPNGADRALSDASGAYDSLRGDPEWAHASLGALALATQAAEGLDAAEPLWADTLWMSEAIDARPMAAVARAMRGLAAIQRGEWVAAEEIVKGAIREIRAGGLDAYITSVLAFIEGTRIATHKGDIESAQRYMGSAARIRPLLTVALPIYSVVALHEKANAYIELADVAGARTLMRNAADILARRPRLGTLVTDHDELKQRLAALPVGEVGPSSLTGAELRLLPLLVTHLTYPEIGERLYVSKHTVKTQAMSIYRKLGVSSRSDAVDKARGIGLISS